MVSLPARMAGILRAPRRTFEAIALAPRWADILIVSFLATAPLTAVVLQTDVGHLALLDRLERTATAFGQHVDDSQYARLERLSERGAAYATVTSLLSGPLLAVGLSAVLFVVFRAAASGGATFRQVLAVVSHAGVILALRQLLAAPATYVRETMASPLTLNLLFSMLDEASPLARFAGIVDFFVLWWVVVLATGMSVLFRRPARPLIVAFVGAYLLCAAALGAVMAALG
jgi:hypothetical protein